MNYRFQNGGLKGHSFGNILLSALEKVYGGFSEGVEEAEKILNVSGEVIPVTTNNAQLEMILTDGAIVTGEEAIGDTHVQETGVESLKYTKKVLANKKAVDAILEAEYIVIGPGDHYTSILPNLIIPKIRKALQDTKAQIIYIPNLTNKKGHTANWTAHDYASDIISYIGKSCIAKILYNTKKPEQKLLKRYEKHYGKNTFVYLGEKNSEYEVVCGDFLGGAPTKNKADTISHTRSFIRHDGKKLAKKIVSFL